MKYEPSIFVCAESICALPDSGKNSIVIPE